uniref:Uncharacterized protein n=1 Tax=Theropithecus gelada TaxID=9565 RepID=A0A8D2E7N4_THEGE
LPYRSAPLNVLSLPIRRFILFLHCITEKKSWSYPEHSTFTSFLDWTTDLTSQGDLQEFTPDEAEFFIFTLALCLFLLPSSFSLPPSSIPYETLL